ncbi:MAG: D-alanine--D-alanine ligase [Candidatus Hydrogenedentes bacterium]|nr:D-alanine--D-alanine ligase [Candidatus Hydrogenedentota bacterium]
MQDKIRVAVLFGGKSAEHEVSLQSAKNVIEAIDKTKYEVVPVGIDKQGHWLTGDASHFLLNADDPKLIALNNAGTRVALAPTGDEVHLIPLDEAGPPSPVDVVFPVLHGPYGEDGTVQGLLKLADVPFVGAGVLGSAVGMDKDVMKRLLRDAGLPIPAFITLRRGAGADYDGIIARLGLPCFVKPANLGSSVGISKAKSPADLERAVADAFQYDHKVIIEEFIEGREIECSVLGNGEPMASVPGEIVPTHEFYSYEAKYIDENGALLKIPADLPEPVIKRVQDTAVAAFKALECEGMARVDVFLRGDDEVIVNEINTLPGFTRISMYPKLWEASGLSCTELIDRLIQLAIERHARDTKLKTAHEL